MQGQGPAPLVRGPGRVLLCRAAVPAARAIPHRFVTARIILLRKSSSKENSLDTPASPLISWVQYPIRPAAAGSGMRRHREAHGFTGSRLAGRQADQAGPDADRKTRTLTADEPDGPPGRVTGTSYGKEKEADQDRKEERPRCPGNFRRGSR